jgi:hypothetical protein
MADTHSVAPAMSGRGDIHKKPVDMTQQTTDQVSAASRRGVRRTVTILVAVVVFFFLLSFVQIVLMK